MNSQAIKIDKQISRNFDVLKFASIMMVFFGHFFSKKIPLAYLPVTVGLIVFSFSSGYFTSLKYRDGYSVRNFWERKFKRLVPNLMVINLLLFGMFLIEGHTGLWSWHTLLNLMGLNGFLNWFMIHNVSPYGRGMWFFTLLLIFYTVYPFLEKMNHKQFSIFVPVFILCSYYFSLHHDIGHALWITACGFIIGVLAGKRNWVFKPMYSQIGAVLIMILIGVMNIVFNVTLLNFFLILSFSIVSIYSVLQIRFNEKLYKYVSVFSVCILEIYLIHGYFLLRITDTISFDFVISLVVVLLLAKNLNILSNVVQVKIKG